MKNNQRNFYRILQVQPDAPLYTIKNNYRTLLHKLRLHPDLGGTNDTASFINLAYATLKSSAKRAKYDRKLLNQYKIEALSKGHLSLSKATKKPPFNMPQLKGRNQRNYYRLLHVQPDAPAAIIYSSYQMLLKKNNVSANLLDEAYSVLNDVSKRKQYDRLLKQGKHINPSGFINENKEDNKKNFKVKVKYTKKNVLGSSPYQPLITHYCKFCKTPQNLSAIEYVDELCIECFSPLYPPRKNFSRPKRYFLRTKLSSTLIFYTCWPGHQSVANLDDLSPNGLRFTTDKTMKKGQIVKIDADQFRSVGLVKYQNSKGSLNLVGIEFITIQFNTPLGVFVSESA